MKDKNFIYKLLMLAAFLCLGVFIIVLIADLNIRTGLFLTLFFVLLALSFNGFEKLKSFSYTVWIFAAVTVSMYFPQYFLNVGDFQLKGLIVPLLQIIMFGMGRK
jgi:BASS family bile acid:Na+ symporter